MSDLQIIHELCRICEVELNIIRAQADALAQYGVMVMEEERAGVNRDLATLIGCGETPNP